MLSDTLMQVFAWLMIALILGTAAYAQIWWHFGGGKEAPKTDILGGWDGYSASSCGTLESPHD